ncbi:hypothetical protein, partial [Vibrio vulnificus]
LLFFLLECDSKLSHYHPNWLNFNSDNYPARGGNRVGQGITNNLRGIPNAWHFWFYFKLSVYGTML